MRYQFTMDQPRNRGRGPALAVAALISPASLGTPSLPAAIATPTGPAPASLSSARRPRFPRRRPPPSRRCRRLHGHRVLHGRPHRVKAGDFAHAESAFVQALALDSTHVRSQLYLSRILIESGRAGDALQHIEAAVALDSTSSEPLRLLAGPMKYWAAPMRPSRRTSARSSGTPTMSGR